MIGPSRLASQEIIVVSMVSLYQYSNIVSFAALLTWPKQFAAGLNLIVDNAFACHAARTAGFPEY